MRQEKISPRQFDILQRELLNATLEGHGKEGSVVIACKAAGIRPPEPFEPVDIVVVPDLGAKDYVYGVYGAPPPRS